MKQSVIILHGWGLNGSKYNQLKKILENKNNAVYAPDMPGFGKEVLESANMDLDDYVLFLERFIKKKKIESPVLIGHSFGGRVAIKYTYKYPDQVSKLILTGVPVIRHINSRQKLAIVLAKIGGSASSFLPKTVFNKLRKMPYYLAGSFDYYKAGPMSKIFVSIISEDLTCFIKRIKIPTFLLWGEKDRLTPATDVLEIKKYMPQAVSVVFPGEGHRFPYENPRLFSKEVLKLIS